MKLTKVSRKIRCDVGGCVQNAAYSIVSTRTGAHTSIYLCDACAKALWQALSKAYEKKTPTRKKENSDVEQA